MAVQKTGVNIFQNKNDIWKLTKNVDAEKFYSYSNLYLCQGLGTSDVQNAKNIAQVCNSMAADLEELNDDYNEYILELDEQFEEIKDIQEDLNKKIKQQEVEKEKILSSASEEGLTQEEKDKIVSIESQSNSLSAQANSKISGINTSLKSTSSELEDTSEKINIAKNYGEVAIEKGQPLSETQDKRKSFWRKAFGGWDKSAEREAGKLALNSGEELLNTVNEHADLKKQIKNKTSKL